MEDEETPHITLARAKFLSENEKKSILKLLEEKKSEMFGEWRVEKVLVKKSTLTPDGPLYETISEVKL